MEYQYRSPMQWQFWVERQRINHRTDCIFTEDEAKYHVTTFKKSHVNYWLEKGYSKEGAAEMRRQHQANFCKQSGIARKHQKDIMPNQVGFWLKKGISLEEAKLKVSERQRTFSYQKCIKKYGYEKGKQMFEDRQKRWQASLKNNNSEQRLKEINNLKKHNLETYIATGRSAQDYVDLRVSRGAVKQFADRALKFLIDNNLELTAANFNDHYQRLLKKCKKVRGQASYGSLKCIIPLYKYCRKLGLKRDDIMLGISGSKEFRIAAPRKTAPRAGSYYDFTILPLKIIVEYNGYSYHPDPKVMSAEEIANFVVPYPDQTVESIMSRIARKKRTAKKAGFTIYEVWSHRDLQQQLDKVKKKINEKYSQVHC